ncbi:MAG: very short patch repair endonuclease [Planctomycetota bacterium]|nr:very short patch repair endonuclease [Planctomycetota bacterium]
MDVYTKAKRSEIMSHIKNRRTAPEDKVASLLRKLRIRYRRNVKSLIGKPDFVVSSAKTVIFVHGCFWHGHTGCKRAKLSETNKAFWKRKIAKNRRRDARTARLLRKRGWHVMTIWQCRLRNPDHVLNRLKKALVV